MRTASPATAALNIVGVILIALLIYVGARLDHAPATNWKFFTWDPLLLFALGVCGAVSGSLLSLSGAIGTAKAELAMSGPRDRRLMPTPLGVLLIAYSVILIYAGFVYYVLAGFVKQAISKSVLGAYTACFVLTVVFALVEQTSRLPLLLFGGNVVFAGFVVGWWAGDQVR